MHAVPALQFAFGNSFAVNERAVGTLEIDEQENAVLMTHFRVIPGYFTVVQLDRVAAFATQADDGPLQIDSPALITTLNDEQSTDALLGVIKDTHDDSYLISLEANRRLGDSWKLSVQASKFLVDGLDQSLKSFAEDDFLQIELGYYF